MNADAIKAELVSLLCRRGELTELLEQNELAVAHARGRYSMALELETERAQLAQSTPILCTHCFTVHQAGDTCAPLPQAPRAGYGLPADLKGFRGCTSCGVAEGQLHEPWCPELRKGEETSEAPSRSREAPDSTSGAPSEGPDASPSSSTQVLLENSMRTGAGAP